MIKCKYFRVEGRLLGSGQNIEVFICRIPIAMYHLVRAIFIFCNKLFV